MNTTEFIKQEEGFRSQPYLDTRGIPTFGYGFTYITKEEANAIISDRVYQIQKELLLMYDWYDPLSTNRKMILVSMVYQLGLTGFSKFKNMISAIEKGDFEIAANEMLDSKWYDQTPNRCRRASMIMRKG